MRVTRYEAPSVPSSASIMGTFVPGAASFEIGVVDLVDRKLLCRSKGKAESSATIEATTTTYYRPDGSISPTSTSADATGDLAHNIRIAAFAELAKMSPAFSPIPKAPPKSASK